ncbi:MULTISPECIES: ABC transporter permease [Streptomyces]|uniref:Transport permease protein n=1 Tax=Streptomyces luteosporeus TaxID=173856 RepID=A0ABP6G8J3_9ACTN
MSATASAGRSGALAGAGDAWLLAGRNMRHIRRRPDQLMAAVLQPIMFFVLFAYVFGGAITVPGGDYKQFLLPGVFGQVIVFGGMAGMCVGIAEDMRNGMMDRFRSLPMNSASVLVGRTLAESVRNLIALVVTSLVGLAFGFRFHGSFTDTLAGAGILLLFGFALAWVLACVGITASSAEGAQTTSMPWLFLLGFVSSAFVPTTAMPGWLQAVADHSPVTLTINAARAWFNGTGPGDQAWQSVLWSLGLLVVFVPLATRLFRRAVAA